MSASRRAKCVSVLCQGACTGRSMRCTPSQALAPGLAAAAAGKQGRAPGLGVASAARAVRLAAASALACGYYIAAPGEFVESLVGKLHTAHSVEHCAPHPHSPQRASETAHQVRLAPVCSGTRDKPPGRHVSAQHTHTHILN